MIDPQVRNCFGRSEPNIHGDPPSAVFVST